MTGDSPLAWVAIDFLSCLLLVVYVLVAPSPKPPTIDTFGQYAVEVTWPESRRDDVDTYVQDPAENVAWYANADVGLMHLEHDDLGAVSDRQRHGTRIETVRDNRERVVLRGVLPGEVTVNVHAYRKAGPAPCPVTVTLYRLRGDDTALLERRVALGYQGEEITAFRFTLDVSGRLLQHNRLGKVLAGAYRSVPP
jgi:hypothetical protein